MILPRLAPALALSLAYALIPTASGRAADPLAYTITIQPSGNKALDTALSASAQLATLRTKAPAGPFALVARARQDLPRLTTAMQSFGYYQCHVTATINDDSLDDPNLPDKLDALPASSRADVRIAIENGPLFHLRQVKLEGPVPIDAQKTFALKSGDPAIAANVLAGGNDLLNELREEGYALAEIDPPIATAIPTEHVLDISFHVTAGPRVDLGPITISGLQRVNESYVRRRLLIRQGQLYQPSKIAAAREDLAAAGVFSNLRISAAKTLNAAGQIPLTIDVSERKLRSVSFNVAYSTDLGGSAGTTWSHHDLFGNAEQLNLTAEITGLGGSADQGIGYLTKAQFLKPDFYHRDQTFELLIEGLKQDLLSYNQTALIAGPSVRRKLSPEWSVSLGLTGIDESILQEEVSRDYTLAALPVSAQFDNTHVASPLDDPLHGMRATLIATPTESFSHQNATFVILQAQASTYFDLNTIDVAAPGMSVIALRGLVGSAQGATDFQLPPDQRFYGGGSATVRGFRYQSIGPQFPNGDPAGGTSIDAATIELRQRLWDKIGAVGFIDAGQVAQGSAPFEGRLEEGAGIGARYYTPIGPIRLDFAVPITSVPHNDSFEIYLGLGQAF